MCQSAVAMETIESKSYRKYRFSNEYHVIVPSLLSEPPVLTSPAPNTLSRSVDVDEQANCVGVDTLFIRRAFFYPADSNKYRRYVESSGDIAFADTDVVFEYVPPGHDEYICIVQIAYNNTRYITTADYISILMPCGNTTVIGEFCCARLSKSLGSCSELQVLYFHVVNPKWIFTEG